MLPGVLFFEYEQLLLAGFELTFELFSRSSARGLFLVARFDLRTGGRDLFFRFATFGFKPFMLVRKVLNLRCASGCLPLGLG